MAVAHLQMMQLKANNMNKLEEARVLLQEACKVCRLLFRNIVALSSRVTRGASSGLLRWPWPPSPLSASRIRDVVSCTRFRCHPDLR